MTAGRPGRYTGAVVDSDGSVEVVKTDERTRRILDAAVQLAEAGGFAAVRLRDVAQTSGVALGTVYKRFRSKEDLLMGVLSHELHDLRSQLAEAPVCGPTPVQRVSAFFGFLTEFLCRRPNLARAVVRSAASGEKALSERLVSFNAKLFELSYNALQGGPGRPPGPGETVMLLALQQVWFSALCGWAGNISDQAGVTRQVAAAASLMMYGVDRMPVAVATTPMPLRVLVLVSRDAASQDGHGGASVERVTASGPHALGELLARADVDALEVDVADAAALASAHAPTWTGTGRPKLVVLTGGADEALVERLTRHVDVVLVGAAGLTMAAARELLDRVYLALATGAAVQDAYEAACGAADRVFTLKARVGADLRALSLR